MRLLWTVKYKKKHLIFHFGLQLSSFGETVPTVAPDSCLSGASATNNHVMAKVTEMTFFFLIGILM